MFRPVESNVNLPQMELDVLRLWEEKQIYEKSLAQRADAPKFVFFEGPPTANGLPHPGHCLTRAIKDLFPRYRTMRGFRCDRKAGWDTHGLPVEVEVCKELGIHSKEEIESFGVEPFIHRCQESVWRYMKQWEQLTKRLGFWIHLDEAYVTYHQSYVESIWWALKTLFDDDLLYKGHKIVWWWAQGGTALSSGEVGLGYREVEDPSVYVRFPLLDDAGKETDTDLLVWTTTPWTLPSNQFAAVHPDLEYSTVQDPELKRKIIVASALVQTIAQKVKRELPVVATCRGMDLLGKRYVPPFDFYYRRDGQKQGKLKSGGTQHAAWRIVAAPFVTTDSGTGAVHQAPAFGEVDFDVLLSDQARFVAGEGPPLICSVAPDGKFTAETPDYAGRWVKDCDKDICRDLRRRGLLYHQEQYRHEYPFCWRAEDDPLIQYPRKSWFIRTTKFKEAMLVNNRKINWLPEHIRDGRFGNFLETNVDWALSRERYWGTPLPIWQCEKTGKQVAIGSYAELLAQKDVQGVEVWDAAKRKNPKLSDDLRVHKPYIDAVTFDSPFAAGARMRRVPDVIDCWFDSGAMPFAQWGYPHQGQERFNDQFPADFISEALDQTRGWFYSLLAISTLLFSPDETPSSSSSIPHSAFRIPHYEYPHPFRNCIVLGLMLGEDGQKMSKSKRNYREPQEIFDRYGADALRWYFFAKQAPWSSIRYSEQAIKESVPEFLLRLWNVYSFFVIYANIDGFDPAQEIAAQEIAAQEIAAQEIAGEAGQLTADLLARAKSYRPLRQRGELDRWITGEVARTAQGVVAKMDAYDNYAAAGLINDFVDALSNWYVRRSRDRFWAAGRSQDKLDAYWTLYECLLTTSKLIAPFVPFIAEAFWQNLAAAAFGSRAAESVHLCDYPTGDAAALDVRLSDEMRVVREIVSLGRAARAAAKLKVRQPLLDVEIVLADQRHLEFLRDHTSLIAEELNVKKVDFAAKADEYISYTVLPNLPRLGPKFGKRLPTIKAALAKADPAALMQQMESTGAIALKLPDGDVSLDRDDVQVRLAAKEGWAAAQGAGCVVVLNTALTPELVREGLARDLVRAIQDLRKETGCAFTDRIGLTVVTDSQELRAAVETFNSYIAGETLAVKLAVLATNDPALAAMTRPLQESGEIDIAGHKAKLLLAVVKQK
ncbi:MAG: isoleucine--tRNA ligase [Planctomycetia bacterium]|nr:isoleucine--tRNA ligase [Planctomycetia bacterium]